MYFLKHKQHVVAPIWIEQNNTSADVVLKWAYHGNYQNPVFKIFLNGIEKGSTTNTYFPISGLTVGSFYSFKVLAMSRLENLLSYAGFVYAPKMGNRLKITFEKVDLAANKDFKSYLIYWSDDGTEPTTLLAENIGANNTTYITPNLADGIVYKFRMRMKDFVGNLSDFGPTRTGVVNTLPESTSSLNVAYNQSTRTATITAIKPSVQDSDAVGYTLYSNHLPGWGLQSDICDNTRLEIFTPSQTLSYVTKELCEGNHIWCFRAIDGSGLESDYETAELNLMRSAGQLVKTLPQPLKPYSIATLPIDLGRVQVTVRIPDPANSTSVNIYRDGALDGSVNTSPTQREYTYITNTLTDGVTYTFTATVVNDSLESAMSDSVTAKADNQAPSGNMTLSLELIQ